MFRKIIRELASLSLLQWWVMLVAILLLPLIALSLKLVGFKQTQNILARFIANRIADKRPSEKELSQAKQIARTVSIAGNHGIYHANCLKQSLLLWWVLARRGINTEIKFGTQKEPDEIFGAHAWVEFQGESLSDSHGLRQQFSAFEKTSFE